MIISMIKMMKELVSEYINLFYEARNAEFVGF